MRNTISLIIPSYNTKEHLVNTYESVRRYYKDVEMVIINDGSLDDTSEWLQSLQDDNVIKIDSKERRGHTFFYDEGMRKASNDIVGILHSDMIIGPNYLENMLKHLEKGKVVCATRVEPPIHPAGLEKIVMDFGMDWNDLKIKEFETFCLEIQKDKDKTTKGIFAPWILYREDHFAIGGHDQTFAPYGYEDSDIFNRWILAGYEMIQSRDSLVYHLTCRGHRWNKGVGIENDDYKETMGRCRRDFIRKWGDWIQNDEFQFPIINSKYDVGICIKNCNDLLLKELEPWCSTIYVDCDKDSYIKQEQINTRYDLIERVLPIDNEKQNNILIEIDGNRFTNNDFRIIQTFSQILDNDEQLHEDWALVEPTHFEIENLKVTIIKLDTYQNNLIHNQ